MITITKTKTNIPPERMLRGVSFLDSNNINGTDDQNKAIRNIIL